MKQPRSLFSLPIQEITFDDIQQFCEQKIAEGRVLDYKRELTNDITKTIAAMANTDGGIILVGIDEEKEQGGRRSFPGEIIGIRNEKNSKQSVINKCYTSLQPVFNLQTHEISIPNKQEYSVLIIRIDINTIPSFPVFHLHDKAIYVRFDDQTTKADLAQIKQLLEKAKIVHDEHQQNYFAWLNHRIPQIDTFTWASVGVALPQKSFIGRSYFNSGQIITLKKAVETYKVGKNLVWIHDYCPLETPVEDANERLKKRLSSFKYISNEPMSTLAITRYGDQGVRICPGDTLASSPDPNRGERFDFQFDARGFMLGSVGFPKETDSIDVIKIWNAIYAILDFFANESIRECYVNSRWEDTGVLLFFEIYNIPDVVTSNIGEKIGDTPKGRFVWGGPHENVVVLCLNGDCIKDLCRDFMGRFLASEGYIGFEDELDQLNFNRI